MNRIVLIGNGFDLAHGLPTRYEDFINWYWAQCGKQLRSASGKVVQDTFCSFTLKENVRLAGWSLIWAYHYHIHPTRYSHKELAEIAKKKNAICEFKVHSVFFSRICTAIESKGWVDIEREYYDLLREVVFKPDSGECSLFKLNEDLRYAQELLTRYLSEVTNVSINCDDRIRKYVYEDIRKDDICISQLSKYYEYVDYLIKHSEDKYQTLLCRYNMEIPNRHCLTEGIKRLRQYSKPEDIKDTYLSDLILPENIMFLNFNYTEVANKYGLEKVSTMIHIHGKLNSPESMIFGYGDELDDGYKNLLKTSNNECLKNIKSIRYLESSNYRKLLEYIESAPYQVYIMGHSCGNSDRTLLNTLFEHPNCVSIKPYYYQKEDGSDNYMEIVQNISRNFTDMKMMRDRVVNKTFCEPLPQTTNNGTTDKC